MSVTSAARVSSNGFEYGVKHFFSSHAGLITEILFSSLKLNEPEALELLNLGAIYLNHQRQTENIHITEQQLLRVHTKPRRYNTDCNWLERIVYENADFIVLNKPSQIPSHPSVDNRIENSLTQLASARKINLHITHRLDTLTSGLIVYAKNTEFVKNFNIQMQNQAVEKRYVALTENSLPLPKKLIHYMQPSPRAPKKLSSSFIEDWAFCELEIVEQKKKADFSWVKINLLTGRTHQIRSQLSEQGSPILGDRLYGAKGDFQNGSIALRACELRFNWGSQRLVFNISEDFDI